jgi:hypothetical protein
VNGENRKNSYKQKILKKYKQEVAEKTHHNTRKKHGDKAEPSKKFNEWKRTSKKFHAWKRTSPPHFTFIFK